MRVWRGGRGIESGRNELEEQREGVKRVKRRVRFDKSRLVSWQRNVPVSSLSSSCKRLSWGRSRASRGSGRLITTTTITAITSSASDTTTTNNTTLFYFSVPSPFLILAQNRLSFPPYSSSSFPFLSLIPPCATLSTLGMKENSSLFLFTPFLVPWLRCNELLLP